MKELELIIQANVINPPKNRVDFLPTKGIRITANLTTDWCNPGVVHPPSLPAHRQPWRSAGNFPAVGGLARSSASSRFPPLSDLDVDSLRL